MSNILPPPPPPPPGGLCPPPPPPPVLGPPISSSTVSKSQAKPTLLTVNSSGSQIQNEMFDNNGEKLPQQDIPMPKNKMKTINWNKIPSNKVVGKHNIWSLVANSHQHSPMADMDWSEMEGLFCQQIPPSSSCNSSPRLGGRDHTDNSDRKIRKDNNEVKNKLSLGIASV